MKEKYPGEISVMTILGISLLLLTPPALSEETPAPNEYKLNGIFLQNLGRDFKGTLLAPGDWKGSDFLGLAAITGTGLLIYAFDQEIHDWVEGNHSNSSDETSRAISYLGNGAVLAGLGAVLYGVGELSDNKSLRKTALLSLESLMTTGVIVVGMKIIAGRARPSTGEPYNTWNPFSFTSSNTSFPSGHSAMAFAMATTIADQSDEIAVDILAYSLATLVGLARIGESKHWASDAFIGSVVGFVVAKKICSFHRHDSQKKISFSFELSPRRQAIAVSLSF